MGERAAGWSAGMLAAAFAFAVLRAGLQHTPESSRAAAVAVGPASSEKAELPSVAPMIETLQGGQARTSGLSPDQLFGAASPAVAVVELKDRDGRVIGQGSGFFVSPDGLLVTNYHVVEGGHAATVRTYGGGQYNVAGVVAADRAADLAVLALSDVRDLPFLILSDAAMPAIGTRVFAIGNPFGLTNTLSDGLVSGVRAVGDPEQPLALLQISAPISPGSSGGPLLSADAHVIGVTTSGMDGGQNLNFAVPVDHVWRLLRDRKLPPRSLASAAPRGTAWDGPDGLLKAAMFLEKGHYGDAALALDAAAAAYANDARYWMLRALLHERGHRNYEVAEDAYRRALTLDPTHRDTQYRFAQFLADRRRYKEAMDRYRELARQEPEHPAPYLLAARVAAKVNDHARALALYDLAFKYDPERDPVLYYERGASLAAVGRDEEAMADFVSALHGQAGTFVAPRLAIGDLHLKHGRLADARETFAEVVRQWPQEGHAHLQLGVIAHRERDPASARTAWTRAIACDPFGRTGNAARRHLASLQATNITVTPSPRR